jgi:hypothetical protein
MSKGNFGELNGEAARSLTAQRSFSKAGLTIFDSVAQTCTVTLGGTFNVGDVYTVVIDGNHTYSLTVLLSHTNMHGVATALAALIDANDVVAATSTDDVITVAAEAVGVNFTCTATATNIAVGTADEAITIATTSTQTSTCTVGVDGTFEAGDVYTTTINGTAYAYTVVAGDTDEAGIATGIAALLNGKQGVTATANAHIVTVTKAAAQFTITGSVTNVGAGADTQTYVVATTSTQTTTATLSGTPEVGDVYTITVGAETATYTVLAADDTLAKVATALEVQAEALTMVTSSALGAVITMVMTAANNYVVSGTATNRAVGTDDQTLTVAWTVIGARGLETDNALTFGIDGHTGYKAATTGIVVGGATIPASSFKWWLVCIDTIGNMYAYPGMNGVNMLPAISASMTPLGCIKVVTDATHTFVPQTTPLNGTGITTTCYNLSCVPAAGYPA